MQDGPTLAGQGEPSLSLAVEDAEHELQVFMSGSRHRPKNAPTKEQAPAYAYQIDIVCRDEAVLRPDPYRSREAWCQARVKETERRLAGRDPSQSAALVNHWPQVREPTRILRYP